ncbi:acyl carrier protein [Brumicola nitratireducens]|uniref:Phosphopantetheine-binding protein n=1 Tax=Glaciecola nitratireducens (strain JCM 12485 / KCTC 12276 / FR1064) TaxID=1085623 RepID=G4QML0_GLANF|nr:phosphopantetheine-binding protein [Glaciecola nitratireducens]AEP30962.1 phosphopantetheine-binding protein [Glaciecola nitratireducens FR1064]
MNNEQTLKTVITRLILEIAPEADIESLDPNEDFREELDLDSIDFMNLLEAVNLETGVTISESDYDQVNTLQSMIEYIESKK